MFVTKFLWKYKVEKMGGRGARDSVAVEALCYKPRGRGFETDVVNEFFLFA
jgi:hypothetical protein